MSVLHRNVPPHYALTAIALALGVSVVAGRESRPPPPAPPPPDAAPRRAAEAPPPLELEKLERPGLGELQANLFAPRRAAPAARTARAAPPTAPPPPAAPPLPFRYLGRYVDGERAAVYLARGDEPVLAVQGETLAGGYRVEAVGPEAITLLYLPLGIRQRLPVPPHP